MPQAAPSIPAVFRAFGLSLALCALPLSGNHSRGLASALLANHDPCAGEPELPALLQLSADPNDPDAVVVRIADAIDGVAQLSVAGKQPVQWTGGGGRENIAMRRGAGNRIFRLRADMPKAGEGRRVELRLTYLDAAGQPRLNSQQAIELNAAPAADDAEPFEAFEGRSADGAAVAASVPADAPIPVAEGAR